MSEAAGLPQLPDPAVLVQPPPIFGFRYQLPPPLPEFEAPADMVQERQRLEERIRALDARIQTVTANTQRARSRNVSREFAWGSVAATVVTFLMMGNEAVAGLGFVLFLVSFGCLWYSWPYLAGGRDRSNLARMEAERAAAAGRMAEVDREVARLRSEHDGRQAQLLAATPTWFGVPIPSGTIRTEVFGWDKIGWEALLATAGGSLLAAGNRLLVLDFSERLVSTLLAHIAAHEGRKVEQVFLPQQAGDLDVLGGLDDEAVVDVLVQAWHGGAVDDRSVRVDMNRDRYVLERVRDCLDGPITLDRLAAGLEHVLQQSADRRRSSALTEEEQAALADSFGAAARSGMRFSDRLMPLTAYIQSLGLLGSGEPRFRLADAGATDLAVIALGPGGPVLDKAALMELLVQALHRHFTTSGAGDRQRPTHLVVLGCDLLHNTALDRLHRFAEHADVGLVLFFSRFDERTASQAGAGHSTQLFMQLGNRGDAERAADHIGLRRYFVLASETVEEGETVTQTHGESLSYSEGTSLGMMAVSIDKVPLLIPNVTRTQGRSNTTNWGKSTAKSNGTSATRKRVHERFVEPEVVQALPRYAFLWKERGDLPLIAGDCDPELAYAPGVARQLPA